MEAKLSFTSVHENISLLGQGDGYLHISDSKYNKYLQSGLIKDGKITMQPERTTLLIPCVKDEGYSWILGMAFSLLI